MPVAAVDHPQNVVEQALAGVVVEDLVGHTISLYPVVLPVLIAPLYLPAVVYLKLRDWADWRVDHVARVMEKLSASLVAALSASLLYPPPRATARSTPSSAWPWSPP